MTRVNVIAKLSEIGKKVDPVIEEYLIRNLSDEFRDIVLHQIRTGGKRIRPALTIICCKAVGGREKDALPIAAAMELIHNYSLIFDDIIDHGEYRRGKPTVRKLYGDVMAMLAGLHYREAITEAVNDSKNSHVLHELVAKTIKDIIEGERLDILFEQAGRHEEYLIKHRRLVITLDDYLKMISLKTGALIRASCVAGGIVADASNNELKLLDDYGISIGIAFQIADDILDIFGEEKRIGKKRGKDIIEHKLGNVVILLSLNYLPKSEKSELLSILRKDVVSEEDVEKAISLISNTKAKEEAYALGVKYVEQALKSIRKLPRSEDREMLEELANFIIYRSF